MTNNTSASRQDIRSGIKPVMGQHFTPADVSQMMVKQIPLKAPFLVADLSVGKGELLWAATLKWKACNVIGFDIDHELVQFCKTRFVSSGKFETLNILESSLSSTNGSSSYLLDRGADVMLSNPPFGVSEKLDPELWKVLETHNLILPSSKGTHVRSEVAFFIRNLQFTRENGYLASLFPENILSGAKNGPFRRFLLQHTEVRHVLSIPLNSFKSCEARICLFVAQKKRIPSRYRAVTTLSILGPRMEMVERVKVPKLNLENRMDPKYHVRVGVGNFTQRGRWDTLGHHLDACDRGYGFYGEERNVLRSERTHYPYIHSTNTMEFLIKGSSIRWNIPPSTAKNIPRAIVQNGDVLLVRVGKGCAGRCSLVHGLRGKGFISDCLYVLRSEKIDRYFLCLFLNTKFAKEYFASSRRGVCSQYITKEDVMAMPFLCLGPKIVASFSETVRKLIHRMGEVEAPFGIYSGIQLLTHKLDNLIRRYYSTGQEVLNGKA